MRIAVNGVGDDEAMFLDITTFGKEAEACSQRLHKGRRIGFDGRLQNRSWTDDDGTKRSKFSGAGHVEFSTTRHVQTRPARRRQRLLSRALRATGGRRHSRRVS
jgi:single-stranded DNA-binding protein